MPLVLCQWAARIKGARINHSVYVTCSVMFVSAFYILTINEWVVG
jgi:hypothetical protein